MSASQGWDTVYRTSPEGWHEMLVVRDGVVHRYVETAELDGEGRAVFEYVGMETPRE